MGVWSGYIGLSIAFVIISAIVLWFSIRTPGQIIIKAMLIPATVWYGLVLYYSVPNLMGWPISQSIPDNSQVLAIRIKEPDPKHNDAGAIYFWVNIKPGSKSPEQTVKALLNPKNVFSYTSKTQPRAYLANLITSSTLFSGTSCFTTSSTLNKIVLQVFYF
jgi:hypothetical protein